MPFFASILKNTRYHFFIVYNLNAADRASAVAGVTGLLKQNKLKHQIAARLPLSKRPKRIGWWKAAKPSATWCWISPKSQSFPGACRLAARGCSHIHEPRDSLPSERAEMVRAQR